MFSDCSDTEEDEEGVEDFAAAEVPSWGVCTPRDAPGEGPRSGPTPHKVAFRSEIEADAFFTPGERGPPGGLGGLGAPTGAPGPAGSGCEGELSCSKVEVAAATAGAAAGPHEGPPAAFSSALHADISRVLNLMEVVHFNSAVAGERHPRLSAAAGAVSAAGSPAVLLLLLQLHLLCDRSSGRCYCCCFAATAASAARATPLGAAVAAIFLLQLLLQLLPLREPFLLAASFECIFRSSLH